MGGTPGVDRKIDAPDVEVQAYQRYSVSGLYCIDLERHLRREALSARRKFRRRRADVRIRGQEGPWEKGGGGSSEVARLESADVGVERLLAGPDRWSEQHRGGRGGGPEAQVHRLRSEALPPRSRLVATISPFLPLLLESKREDR